MSALTDKFDVLRGWEPGGDASIDQSFPPALSGGLPVTLQPGYIVQLASTGRVDVATSPASVALGTANIPPVYVVVEGNGSDTTAQFVEKVVCLRGKLTVKTDKLAAAQSFPVGGGVSYSAGLLTDKLAAGTTHQIGIVIANNVATDGTITVELDL
jgi:hypothetical protein